MAFAKCFKKQLENLGLPAPTTLFNSVASATATISALSKVVSEYGTKVTIGELFGASFVGTGAASIIGGLGEFATVLAGVTASFYLGACIGAVLACTIDAALADNVRSTGVAPDHLVAVLAQRHISLPDNMMDLMKQNPEMRGARPAIDYDSRMARLAYGDSESGSGAA